MTAVASFWMVGSLFVSGVAWCLFRDTELSVNSSTWRCFAAICALPSALGALMVYRYVPESPRFLAAKHDYSQAARSCNQMLSSLDMTADSTILIHHAHVPYLHPMNPKELESTHAIETNACRDEMNTTQHSIFIQSIQALVETLGKLYSRQLLSQRRYLYKFFGSRYLLERMASLLGSTVYLLLFIYRIYTSIHFYLR